MGCDPVLVYRMKYTGFDRPIARLPCPEFSPAVPILEIELFHPWPDNISATSGRLAVKRNYP